MKLNVDKMRRQVARNIPDVMHKKFDTDGLLRQEDMEFVVKSWFEKTHWKWMRIKHGNRIQDFRLWYTETFGRYLKFTSEVILINDRAPS